MNVVAMLDYSEIDSLTGLLNRKTFDDHLMRILASLAAGNDERIDAVRLPRRRKPARGGACHWLAVMDIDHFKRVNDEYGHLIGDEVLLLVATMMKSGFRSHDKLFRFGGEEFVVVLKRSSVADARRIFDRFRKSVAGRIFPQVGRVTISIGYTPIRLGDQPSVVLDNADSALYWAKEHGRNLSASYPELLRRGELETKHAAIDDVEFF
jgi:diguanylate cyclase (GGDEF)-like protein